jgi:RHS repeat-associated protein
MINRKSKHGLRSSGIVTKVLLAAVVLLMTWGQTNQSVADCPDIGFNNGYINYDTQSMTVTRGEGVSCCLHHLQVLVVYEGLEPGDMFHIHGVTLSNDTDETISGHRVIDLFATGNEQISAYYEYVSLSSSVFIAAWEVSSDSGGTCSGLAENYSAYWCNNSTYISLSNGSVELKLRFGVESALDKADPKRGLLWMRHEKPNALLTSPKSLVYSMAKDTAIDVVRNQDRTIRQIRAEDGLLDINPLDEFGYEIQLYADQNVTGWNGEQYETNGAPHYTWKIHNPDRDLANHRLRIEEHTRGFGEDAPPVVHEYIWNETNEAWSLTLGGGLSQDRKQVTWNSDRTQKTELEEMLDPQTGEVARRIERIYGQIHPDKPHILLLSETADPGPNQEQTQWSYIDDPQSPNFGRKAWVEYPDGNWKAWEYDDQGRILRAYSPWLNQSRTTDETLARVLYYSYEAPGKTIDTGHEPWRPRMVTETILGREINRTYHLISQDQEWEIRCIEPGAKWDAPDNMVTKTTALTEGPFAGEPSRIEHADGTVSTYDYRIQNDRRIETISRGIITGQKSSEPTEGTHTITITGSAGELYETRTEDIVTGLMLDNTTYTEHDPFHRPERIDYQDGTYERILHDCCGPSQRRDREGRWTNLVFDSLKRPVYEITDTETRIIQYNAAGDVTEIQRLNTQDRTLETVEQRQYDLKGKEILADNKGRQRRLLQTTNPQETITENPDGNNRIETRARDGQLFSITGTSVHGIRYAHAIENDKRHHVRTETQIQLDTQGNDTREWTKTYYDALNRPYKTERADGAQTLTIYNQLGQITSQTDPDGVTTLYDQDPLGNVTTTAIDMNRNGKIDSKGNDRITRTERNVVDIKGVVYTQTRTYQWQTEKDAEPTLVSETLQSTDGLISQQTLFPSQTQWLSTTTWTEEDTDQPIKTETTIHPDGTQTIRTFERTLLITEHRLGSDGTQIARVDYTYDDQNHLITQTDAYAGTTEYQYDDQGRRTVMIQPAPEEGAIRPVTRFTCDEMDRIIAIQHPDGTITHSTYWPTGELKRTWGSRQYPVEYTYDYAGRKSTMTTWQDFENNTGKAITQWIYDEENGNLISKRYHDGKGPDYDYTQAGRLKQRTWARGIKIEYKYNNAGGLEKIDYKDKGTPDVAYQYDRFGRRIETKQGKDYVQQMTYDDLGRVLTETITQPGVKEHKLTRSYNDAGKPSGYRWKKGKDQLQVDYGYGTSGRINTVSDGQTKATYEYLASSNHIEHTTYHNQNNPTMQTTQQYDRLGRLLDTTTRRQSDSEILSSHRYTYNLANQRTTAHVDSGNRWDYEYDGLGQVISGKQTKASGESHQNHTYDFDTIGNRKQTISQGVVEVYEVNPLNQYKSRETTENGRQTSDFYQHDADGNLIQDTKWSYKWNADNRLIAMEDQDSTNPQRLEFRYDPQGRRIQKAVYGLTIVDEGGKGKKRPKWNLIKQHYYIYNEWNLIAEIDDKDNLVRTHLWGADLSGTLQGAGGVGGLLMTTNHQKDEAVVPLFDGIGKIVQYADAQNGAEVVKFAYDPFGNKLSDTAGLEGSFPFRFSSKFSDDESGLTYYGVRYYNPETGRWLNRDPLEEMGGMNLSVLLRNNPTCFIDVLGMYEWGGWWSGFSGSLVDQWTSMGDALFNGLGGNAAVSSYYDVRLTPPQNTFENCAWGQSEAIGGATEVIAKGCIITAVTATVTVSYLGTAEFIGAYGSGSGNLSIHASMRAGERTISTWAIQGAQRWGVRSMSFS